MASPCGNSTTVLSADWTTCAAVSTLSLEMRTPEPNPSELTSPCCGNGASPTCSVLTITTAGCTLRKTSLSCWPSTRVSLATKHNTSIGRTSWAARKHLRCLISFIEISDRDQTEDET